MYALFEDDQFVKLVPAIGIEEYQTDPKYTLYQVDTSKLYYPIDKYKFILDVKHNLIAYLSELTTNNIVGDSYCNGHKDGYFAMCEKFKEFSFIQKLKFLFGKGNNL